MSDQPTPESTASLVAPDQLANDLHRLGLLAMYLEREAKHWADHPDSVYERRPEGSTGPEWLEARREFRASFHEKFVQNRGTHTDITLRSVAAELRQIAARHQALSENNGGLT